VINLYKHLLHLSLLYYLTHTFRHCGRHQIPHWTSSFRCASTYFLDPWSYLTELVAAEKSCASSCFHWTYPLILPTSVRIVHMTLIGVVGVRLARYTLHRVHSVYYPSCGYLHHDSGSCAIIRFALFRLGGECYSVQESLVLSRTLRLLPNSAVVHSLRCFSHSAIAGVLIVVPIELKPAHSTW